MNSGLLASAIAVAIAVVAAIVVVCIRRPKTGLRIIILMFIAAPMSPTPGLESVFYIFGSATSLILLAWLVPYLFRRPPFNHAARPELISLGLKLWLLLCVVSLPLSIAFNSGSMADRLYFFVKGVLPFWFLTVFFLSRALRPDIQETKRILGAVLVVGLSSAVICCVIYAITWMRVVWIWEPLAFPFPVLAANISFAGILGAKQFRRRLLWIGALTLSLAGVVVNFTRAEIISLFLGLLTVGVLIGRDYPVTVLRRVSTLTASLVGLAILGFVSLSPHRQAGFSELLWTRAADSSTADARLVEWRGAYTQFIESPIVGKGVGYQLERNELGQSITSGYVHNQVFYTAMTTGMIGLIVYFSICWQWLGLVGRMPRASEVSPILASLHACVLSLLVYALLYATFRTIQHNYLLGLFLGLILTLTPARKERKYMFRLASRPVL